MPSPPSVTCSPDHLAVLGLTVAANVLLCAAARRNPAGPWIPRFMKGLAILQVVNVVASHAYLVATERWTAEWALPCQLCDAAIAVSVLGLFRPAPLLFELTYFWGLGGALQGLVTPAVEEGFPDPVFLQFFVVHVGLVTAALFQAFGLGMRPRRRVVLRMMLWTNACAAMAAVTSWITGGNYMFLRHPPPTGSLLDLLGTWPWYIVWGEVVAFAAFSVLALPFRFRTVPAA
jgi:hypothetical integral membrane protein (TIGR02206 family)